jgi:amicoumacin kinase
MDPRIAARFNDDILAAVRQRFAIAPSSLKILDGFESFIYSVARSDGDYILRIGHSERRSPDHIRGEVEWINFLAERGVGVARACPSDLGNIVEPIDDHQGGQFLCTLFVRAPGEPLRSDQLSEHFFSNYGRLIGQMHALTKDYLPINVAWKRYAWDGSENNTPDRQLPEGEQNIRRKHEALLYHLRALPCERDGYGLIHQDAHPGNFFVDEHNRITLFDFDDCVYGHFIYDISMVFFYTAVGQNGPAALQAGFFPFFFSGYREENRLDPCWLAEIPHFLKLREIDLFAAILFTMGENPKDEWCSQYMNGRRQKIENDVPLVDFDWNSLAQFL